MRELDELGERFWAWRAHQQPRTRDDIPRLDRPSGWLPEVDAGLAGRRHEELGAFEAGLAAAELDGVAARIDACTEALTRIDPSAAAGLAAAGAEAGAALEQFGAGLAARLADLPPAVPVGRERYEWFLREVACVPLTVEEIAGIGRREYERAVWLERLHATRNRDVPVPPLPADAGQQVRAQARNEAAVRQFYADRGLLSQPDSLRHYLTLPMPGYLAPLTFLGVADELTGPGRLTEN